jgi:maleate isomerase
MDGRKAIGSIVPSSNRVVERTLSGILPRLPGLDSCIARITYYGAGIGQPADAYDAEPYRHAAWQLGHAQVGAICWNGTRGAGLGLDADRALCATMAEAAGCPATTAALATHSLLQRLGARRLGLVVPGTPAQAAEAAAGLGGELVAQRALGLTDNHAAALVPPARLAGLVREIAQDAAPDAILVWSTNLAGLEVMAPMEAELGIPVIDSAAAGAWGCLAALGVPMEPVAPLGRVFRVPG